MRSPIKLTAAVVAVGLCLLVAGLSQAAVSSVYWRLDLHQGAYIIAYGQGTTEQAAWDDCYRLKAITRAMTAAETRRNAVAAITAPTVRWCQNPKRYATISPDPPAGTATLSWQHTTPPAITGFRIVHGLDWTALTNTIQVENPALRTYTLTNLSAGNRCFAVKAYDATGVESLLSNVVCKAVL